MVKGIRWDIDRGVYFRIPEGSEDALCYVDGKLMFYLNYYDLEDLYHSLEDGEGYTFEGPGYSVTMSQEQLEELFFILNDNVAA